MRIGISVLAVLVVLAMSRPAHAQYSYSATGLSPNTSFAGRPTLGTQFMPPGVASVPANAARMNLFSNGLLERMTTMSFFPTTRTGYNDPYVQYPQAGLSFLTGFSYRVGQFAQ